VVGDVSGEERLARAALTYVAEPGDPVMGALLRTCAPAEIVAALIQGRAPVPAAGPTGAVGPDLDRRQGLDGDRLQGLDWDGLPGLDRVRLPGLDRDGLRGLDRALARWAGRLGEAPTESDLGDGRRAGIRLVCPGDPEWPSQLEVLGDASPWGLWVRGSGDLRYACLRSVSVVGTRAATAYGSHVCTEMAATLAERGWTVVSGGAYGTRTQTTRNSVTGALAATW
jgi:DNA processing protein